MSIPVGRELDALVAERDDSLDYHKQPVTSHTTDSVTPNRFDPYEALDMIDAILDSSSNLPTHTTRGDGYLILDLDRETLCREVKALRAYITGMEK